MENPLNDLRFILHGQISPREIPFSIVKRHQCCVLYACEAINGYHKANDVYGNVLRVVLYTKLHNSYEWIFVLHSRYLEFLASQRSDVCFGREILSAFFFTNCEFWHECRSLRCHKSHEFTSTINSNCLIQRFPIDFMRAMRLEMMQFIWNAQVHCTRAHPQKLFERTCDCGRLQFFFFFFYFATVHVAREDNLNVAT